MYKLILPVRYLLKRRITCLAIASVALCVFIVVVVMTVHNGIVIEWKRNNHNFAGDCVVGTDSLVGFAYYGEFLAELKKQDFVKASSAVVKSYGLMGQPSRDINAGVEIMGIDPESFSKATGFGETLFYHKADPANAFVHNYEPQLPGCVVGIIIIHGPTDRSGKYYHDQTPSRYELMISCFPLTTKGALAKAGTGIVNSKNFCYSDDSHTAIPRVDGNIVYLPFEYAQKLCGMAGAVPRATAIHIKFREKVPLENGYQKIKTLWAAFVAEHGDRQYANLLENVTVQTWKDFRRSSIAPMEKEQIMLILLFMMLGVITVFVIFVVFYMIISHKSKDIGILKSIGVSDLDIVQLFLLFAMLVGLIGAVVGSAGACAFLAKINDMEHWLFERFGWQLWDRSVYAIGEIPDKIEWEVLTIIAVSAIVASLAGALLPTIQAARRLPAQTLQVNQL